MSITRTDLFRCGFYVASRQRWLSAIALFGFSVSLWQQWQIRDGAMPLDRALIFVVLFLLIWALFWLLFVALTATITALRVSSCPGILGSHYIEIREDGLFESTNANETLTRWSAIRSATLRHRYILVRLTWWLFHLIPIRAFPDKPTADAFFRQLQMHIDRKAQPTHPSNG